MKMERAQILFAVLAALQATSMIGLITGLPALRWVAIAMLGFQMFINLVLLVVTGWVINDRQDDTPTLEEWMNE